MLTNHIGRLSHQTMNFLYSVRKYEQEKLKNQATNNCYYNFGFSSNITRMIRLADITKSYMSHQTMVQN